MRRAFYLSYCALVMLTLCVGAQSLGYGQVQPHTILFGPLRLAQPAPDPPADPQPTIVRSSPPVVRSAEVRARMIG